MLGTMLENVRRLAPRIHCISNYVTANDCANILLACGAAPIMADDPGEVEEVTRICQGLTLNLGTPSPARLRAMEAAGRAANRQGNPAVFDPVGVGVSRLRGEGARRLLQEVRFSVIRGNASEIGALMEGTAPCGGVDAVRTEETEISQIMEKAKEYARRTGAVIAVTGAVDVVADGDRAYRIGNGQAMMSRVTGTGCQLSALITAFAAANPQRILEATAAAVCAMGICGQIAYQRLRDADGTATFRGYIIDAMSNLTPWELEEKADYEIC